MIDKVTDDALELASRIPSGATLLVSGFGPPGQPTVLIDALLDSGATDLTIVNNNAAAGGEAIGRLFQAGRVRKSICSFPKAIGSTIFDDLYLAGKIELELLPQGTIAERIRAAGAGLAGFYTPTGYGTELAEGKETRIFEGRGYVLERPIHGDYALIRAHRADRLGNLTYRKTARNFGPIMAMAADVTLVEAEHIVDPGAIDPENVVTPGIYVDWVVPVNAPAVEMEGARS